MSENNNALDRLFVDKETVAREVSELGSGVLQIDRTDCTPIIPIPLKDLSNPERILLELATVYLCFLSGLRETEILSRDELVLRGRFKKEALRARLSDLRKNGLVQSVEQGECITVRGLLEFKELLEELRRFKDDD